MRNDSLNVILYILWKLNIFLSSTYRMYNRNLCNFCISIYKMHNVTLCMCNFMQMWDYTGITYKLLNRCIFLLKNFGGPWKSRKKEDQNYRWRQGERVIRLYKVLILLISLKILMTIWEKISKYTSVNTGRLNLTPV